MTPVGSSPRHVKTQKCRSLRNVVFVVDIRKCWIVFCSTIIVEASTPRGEVPGFKLCQVLRLGIGVVLEPLVIISNQVEASVDVCA